MLAEDLLLAVRSAGFAPAAIAAYLRGIVSRVSQRLPRQAELVRSVAAVALLLFTLQFAAALFLSAQ